MVPVALDPRSTPAPQPPVAARSGEFWITTDAARFDLSVVHGFLERAPWSPGVSLETVQRAIAHSLAFGLFHGERQIGFARAISDRATFAYLADVFVLESYRGRGLGSWMVGVILAHPELRGLRRWLLKTREAHALYRKHGFVPLPKPERWMLRVPSSTND